LYLLGGISPAAWQDLESGQVLTAADAGITSDLLHEIEKDRLAVTNGDSSVPGLAQHAADLLGSSDPGSVRVSIAPHAAAIVKWWKDGENEAHFWQPVNFQILGDRGLSDCPRMPGSSMPVSRAVYDAAMGRWNFRFASLNDGVFTFSFPYHYKFSLQLSSAPSDVSQPVKYSELPASEQDAFWASAQAWAAKMDQITSDAVKNAGRPVGGG
jgi:hypothetical protein